MGFDLYRRVVGFTVDGGQTRWGRVLRLHSRWYSWVGGIHRFYSVRDLHTGAHWMVGARDIHTIMPETY